MENQIDKFAKRSIVMKYYCFINYNHNYHYLTITIRNKIWTFTFKSLDGNIPVPCCWQCQLYAQIPKLLAQFKHL